MTARPLAHAELDQLLHELVDDLAALGGAARSRDQADIAFLLRHCAVGSVAEADDVLGRYYPGDSLSNTAIARVKAALGL
jgi:predicted ArsR family transcriptional regulator